jgi:hypothetical protein
MEILNIFLLTIITFLVFIIVRQERAVRLFKSNADQFKRNADQNFLFWNNTLEKLRAKEKEVFDNNIQHNNILFKMSKQFQEAKNNLIEQSFALKVFQEMEQKFEDIPNYTFFKENFDKLKERIKLNS